MFQINMRGYSCRSVSLSSIFAALDINVGIICETFLRGKAQIEMENYVSFSKNRSTTNGGGIATLVNEKDHMNCLKLSD